MGQLILRSSAVSGGGGGVTFDSGWSLASGTVANGQRATFSYAPGALVIPADPAPARYTLLDGSLTRHANSRLSTNLTSTIGTENAWDTSNKPPWATSCLQQNFQVSNGTIWFNDSDLFDFAATRRCFVSLHTKWNFDLRDQNSKRWRIWPDVGGSASSGVGSNPDTYITEKGTTGFRAAIEATAGDLSTTIAAYNQSGVVTFVPNWITGSWRSEEIHFEEGSLDTYNGTLQRRENGRFHFDRSTQEQKWKNRTTADATMQRHYRAINTTQISNQNGSQGDPVMTSADHAWCWGYYQNDNWFRCFSSPESSITSTASNGSNDLAYHPIMQAPVGVSGSQFGFAVDLAYMNPGDYLYMVENDAVGTFRRICQVP